MSLEAPNWRNDVVLKETPTFTNHVKSLSANGKYEKNVYVAFAIVFAITLILMILLRPPLCVWRDKNDYDAPLRLQWNAILWAAVAGGVAVALVVYC